MDEKFSFYIPHYYKQSSFRDIDYSGSWKKLTLDVREGPASSIFSSSFEMPASATLAMKSSSTKTLAVLKFLCMMGGFRLCKWHKPAVLETKNLRLKWLFLGSIRSSTVVISVSLSLPLAAPRAIDILCLNSSLVDESCLVSARKCIYM